jgi:hypothetical protein
MATSIVDDFNTDFYNLYNLYLNTDYGSDISGRKEAEDRLHEIINDWYSYTRRKSGSYYMAGIVYSPFMSLLNLVRDAIDSKSTTDLYKELNVVYDGTEHRNGYLLPEVKNNLITEDMMHEWAKIWNTSKDVDFREFYDEYLAQACTEWYKQDEFGECFGGYWKSNVESGKQNAFGLSGKRNGIKLFELPFPQRLIFKTIDIGCSNRHESVAYSNLLLCWFVDKARVMNIELKEHVAIPMPDGVTEHNM